MGSMADLGHQEAAVDQETEDVSLTSSSGGSNGCISALAKSAKSIGLFSLIDLQTLKFPFPIVSLRENHSSWELNHQG